jgi:4-diphosphocytidyl-2-C-methyl-D-erythritol kinase
LFLPFVFVSPNHSDFSAYPEFEELGNGGFALQAPAKINLGLRVFGRRPDGYHEIETLFQEISLCDRLEFRPSSEWLLEIHGAELDTGTSNLVTLAGRLLSTAAGVPCCGQVALQKKIPVGGGLGGGSSDAAITLIGLNRMWGLHWSIEALRPFAAQIGSDCPFFLSGGLAHGSGRGEILEMVEGCVPGIILLVVPDFGVSTAWAYSAGGFPLTVERKSVIFKFRQKDISSLSKQPFEISNDLENIVLSRYSELGWVKQTLLNHGAERALLSGSGSIMYGIFQDSLHAELAAQQFGSPFRVITCRAVSRKRRT